ncbi:MAG: SRPBCC family protein [Gemmatimonadales bacterium]|nr:SRPBCC family protein [Gemmatimonadales bacterium]MCW5777722.1 SRPBCC family protein [Phycisphaeraceae bacterium]
MNRRQRRRRSQVVRALALLPLLMTGALWAVGSRLPVRHAEESVAWIPASPESVWLVLTDLDGMPAWRRDLASVERLPNGAGAGLIRWREVSAAGRQTAMERLEALPPERLVVRPAGVADSTRRWIYRLTPKDRGTEVVVRDERDVANPVRRVLVGVLGADRSTIDGMAEDLERRLVGRAGQLAARGL